MPPVVEKTSRAAASETVRKNRRRGKPRKRPGKNYRERIRYLAQCQAALPLSPLKTFDSQRPPHSSDIEIKIPELLQAPSYKLASAQDLFHRDNSDVLFIPVESSPEKFPQTPKKLSSVTRRVLF